MPGGRTRDAPPEPRLLDCGDAALSVDFGDRIDPQINARVIALDAALSELAFPGVIESVPTYRALMIHFDPTIVRYQALCDTVRDIARSIPALNTPRRRWRVPVVYGDGFGVDLGELAARKEISQSAFVRMHAGRVYTVYMIGFMPGFAYLGGLDPRLASPRRQAPRAAVPDRSISIGGAQSAIGSLAAPSGWHLVGRTPVYPYRPGRDPEFLFQAGDEVMFDPVPSADWPALDAAAASGEIVATRQDR